MEFRKYVKDQDGNYSSKHLFIEPIEYMVALIKDGTDEDVAYKVTCILIQSIAKSAYKIQYESLMKGFKEALDTYGKSTCHHCQGDRKTCECEV